MTNDDDYYKDLLRSYLGNRCNSEELNELMDFLGKEASNTIILLQLKEQYPNSFNENTQTSLKHSNLIREALMKKIAPSRVLPFHKSKWLFAAAASIILMSVGSYFFLSKNSSNKEAIVNVNNKGDRYKNDVLPGGNKAVLKLADGSTIVLDDAQNGVLARQGMTKVIKMDGKLSYNSAHNKATQILYNMITTPRGGQYEIGLPDGSHVWLNAASTLRFPTAFAGKERRVEITGEAYFEVAKSKTMPFIVGVNTAEIRVMGTHFNVMAYNEEAAIKTTLIEGSVRFKNGKDSSILKPGQQAQLTNGKQIRLINNIDLEGVMAWKNGIFNFGNADLQTVMKQLCRWYDVEVEYHNSSYNRLFVGEMTRSSRLSDVLKALELAGNLHFGIEGKKVIVMSE
jgi:transmembrane sensor